MRAINDENACYFNVMWVEANKHDELVMRRKEFTSFKAQQRFIAKIERADNFIRLEAVYSNN